MDDAQLRTVWQQRQVDHRISYLSEPLAMLMKNTLARRFKQLSRLGEIWDDVIPGHLLEHTALESFHQGVLTVRVDNSSRRFYLQTLLRGGLQKEIQRRFAGPLNKIRLQPGRFYALDVETGQKRYEF
jgi:predicted nucleic acid-binding Zn ribbon protein